MKRNRTILELEKLMKRNRTTLELEKLQDKKQNLSENRNKNLNTITKHYIEASTLIEAKSTAEKIDKGESITDQERNKFNDIKNKYSSFFDDTDTTNKDGLKDVISYIKEDKKAYINKDHLLKDKAKSLDGEIKNTKSSLIDDFADPSTEMPDIIEFD